MAKTAKQKAEAVGPDLRREWAAEGDKLAEKKQAALLAHYKAHPFDKMRDGVLQIRDKNGDRVPFQLWDHQKVKLDFLEEKWLAKEPARVIELKARQIGSSTFSMGVSYCITSTHGGISAHLVAHQTFAVNRLLRMFDMYYRFDLPYLKPKMSRKTTAHKVFDDDALDVVESEIIVESAMKREDLARSGTFHITNLSELAFWAAQVESMNALKPSIPKVGRIIVIAESTGYVVNDLFYDDYFATKNGEKPGWRSWFVPWHKHPEYSRPFDKGVDPRAWMREQWPDDLELAEAYKLKPEQLHWYITERDDWMGKKRETIDGFRREYPACEDEAFAGTGNIVFDSERVRKDQVRTKTQHYVRGEELQISTSLMSDHFANPDGYKYGFTRGEIVEHEDASGRITGGSFAETRTGAWTIWEMPRENHLYLFTADPAEGKEAVKGLRKSGDYSVVDGWRYTFDEGERVAFTQVCQLRSQTVDPRELARQTMAASCLYRDSLNNTPALVCPERNNHGIAFIAEGQRHGMRFYYRILYGKWNEEVTREPGFISTTGTTAEGARIVIITQARKCHLQNMYVINSESTSQELGTFIRHPSGKYGAIGSRHDDTVTCFLLCPEAVKFLEKAPAPIMAQRREVRALHDVFRIGPLPPKLVRPGVKQEFGAEWIL